MRSQQGKVASQESKLGESSGIRQATGKSRTPQDIQAKTQAQDSALKELCRVGQLGGRILGGGRSPPCRIHRRLE
jgi:hypothetical protein